VRAPVLLYLTGKFGHNDCFQAAVEDHQKVVEASGVFDTVYAFYKFPQPILEDERFFRHTQFLRKKTDSSHRGGGYWFWKAALALEILTTKAAEGDLLVYSDIDRADFISTISVVSDAMKNQSLDFAVTLTGPSSVSRRRQNSKGLIVYNIGHRWTKRDIFEEFKIDPRSGAGNATQFYANLWVVRNTPASRRLIQAWVRCVSDWHLVSDEPSRKANPDDFRENRHDQSLLSMLLKSAGVSTEEVALKHKTEPHAGMWNFFSFEGAKFAYCV